MSKWVEIECMNGTKYLVRAKDIACLINPGQLPGYFDIKFKSYFKKYSVPGSSNMVTLPIERYETVKQMILEASR